MNKINDSFVDRVTEVAIVFGFTVVLVKILLYITVGLISLIQ
jgi:hypothetical protein